MNSMALIFHGLTLVVVCAFTTMIAVTLGKCLMPVLNRYPRKGMTVFIFGCIVATLCAQKPSGDDDDEDEGDEAAAPLLMSCGISFTDYGALIEDSSTNAFRFGSIERNASNTVLGLEWSYGLSFRNPILSLMIKDCLTNDWQELELIDTYYAPSNKSITIFDDALPTNLSRAAIFFQASLGLDDNPLRNTDGDYWTDAEELGNAEVLESDEFLWFDVSSFGTDLLSPYYRTSNKSTDIDFSDVRVLADVAYSGARVCTDGYVYFRAQDVSRIRTDHCPGVRAYSIKPMAEGGLWNSGMYYGTVTTNGVTYDVIQFRNIGLYAYINQATSPLISCEVILLSAEPDVVYVSYGNVDEEVRETPGWIGYFDKNRQDVFFTNCCYSIEYPSSGARPHPYTTVKYTIGTGTDPRVFDAYTPAVCGQPDGYREQVEAAVGSGLENGLYELTVAVTNAPPLPVRITVGDETVTMTNIGECVFLCEKGKEYPLSVAPTFFSGVAFSARDDITPVMMAMNAGSAAGAAWTIDDRLLLTPPDGSAGGTCLWLPKFTAGPDVVGHWFPSDGNLRFTAYLTDYSGSNTVSYFWTSSGENVNIVSPTAQSTVVSLVDAPGWGSADLTAKATVDGYELVSTLSGLEYGTNATPVVRLDLVAPSAVLLNSNEVSSAKLRRFDLRFYSDLEPDGRIELHLSGNVHAVNLWTSTNRTESISNYNSWNASEFNGFSGYIEGLEASETVDDVTLTATYLRNDGDDVVSESDVTVIDVLDVVVPSAPTNGLVVLTNVAVGVNVQILPADAGNLVSTDWSIRALSRNGQYGEWCAVADSVSGNHWNFSSPTGGIFQIRADVTVDETHSGWRQYIWSNDEDTRFGLRRAGDMKAIGVADAYWQIVLRGNAASNIGSTNYAHSRTVPAEFGFSEQSGMLPKCSIFVAHTINGAGLDCPVLHRGRFLLKAYPPTANDWCDSTIDISGWRFLDTSVRPQPGYVASLFADPMGHVGIIDFDGVGISAQGEYITRKSCKIVNGGVYRGKEDQNE